MRYWGTDGECANNSIWMRKTCPRTCGKLEACRANVQTRTWLGVVTTSRDTGPHSALCSEAFECPVANDERADCADSAASAALANPRPDPGPYPNPNPDPNPNLGTSLNPNPGPNPDQVSAALARGGPPFLTLTNPIPNPNPNSPN